MAKRVRLLALGWVGLAMSALVFPALRAQEVKVKAPAWKQGMELQVRKVGEKEFTKDTKRYGLEVYKDENTGKLVYITETGSVATINEGKSTGVKDKAPEFKHGMELQVRKAGEKEFTKSTKTFSIEVFYDPVNSALIYITEIGTLSVVPVSAAPGESKDSTPSWQYAMELQARKAGEADFTKDTAKFGVEVFKDENNGNLIYICDTGSIAVVPGAKVEKAGEFPWKYAMELRVRKAGQPDFNDKTPKYGVEVFRDDRTGNGIYVSQFGSISIIGDMTKDAVKEKAPIWMHGMELKARKAGEAEFSNTTKRFSLEVFKDDSNGALVYATELGGVPVVK
jgi:hypothetical protein